MPKIANTFSSFEQYLVGTIQHIFHQIACRMVLRDCLHHGSKAQHEALKTLQECVMQLSRDTRPLFQLCTKALLNLRRSLFQSQQIKQPKASRNSENAKNPEPHCLFERWQHNKL